MQWKYHTLSSIVEIGTEDSSETALPMNTTTVYHFTNDSILNNELSPQGHETTGLCKGDVVCCQGCRNFVLNYNLNNFVL
jgi:hypothetical protein